MKSKSAFFVKTLLVLTFFLSSVITAFSQKQYKFESVPGDPLNTRIYTLDNGLKVYMTVYKDAPNIQTYIATRAGSKHDPEDATGLAHYFEHMMFKGTDLFGTVDFAKEGPIIAQIDSMFEEYRKINPSETDKREKMYKQIDSLSTVASQYAIPSEYDKLIGAIGGSGTNAYTSLEQTVYVNEIPANQLENWLTIESSRFSHPVLRIFHTELETIYEEKNMTLSRDDVKVYFGLLKELFKKHAYGTHTVIGTTEHLKSPSMKRIREQFKKYYVPNNLAICLSGDLDPEKTIALIDKYFGWLQKGDVPKYTFEKEEPITKPFSLDIFGPDAEWITLAYRLNGGANSPNADLLTIFDMILSNRMAGLIDLNLNQSQKVLKASSSPECMEDYCIETFEGKPKEGQTLDQVKDLILGQIELVKKGEFPDWLIGAIIEDLKLKQIKDFESNNNRARVYVETFTTSIPWDKYVNRFDRLSKITKEDIVKFANENFNNNYLAVYKKVGKNEIEKIKKPKITKIKINRDDKSEFLKQIEANKVIPIEPVFLDYKKDINSFTVSNNVNVNYLKNSENQTFDLYYVFDMGSANDRKLPFAIEYFKYLGTSKYTPDQIKQEFFKIGCSYNVNIGLDRVYVTINGLSDNFEKAVDLFEQLLNDPLANADALKNLVSDKLKEREDAKKNQQRIFSAMVMYGIYGPKSPATNLLSAKELNALTAQELVDKIKNLEKYEHHILFYGSPDPDQFKNVINKYHKTPATLTPIPTATVFPEIAASKNIVYAVDFDMKQDQILMLAQGSTFDPQLEPVIRLYNEYFGGSMNAIVFQELRESRALCYSAMSFYRNLLNKKESHFYNISFIMTQADKANEAMTAFLELLNTMPNSPKSFELAKSSIISTMRSERITKSDILFDYEDAKKLGIDYDIRKNIFDKVPSLTFDDINKFQQTTVKGKPQVILVLGDTHTKEFKIFNKYGKVKKLTLEDVFGY